MRNGKDVSACRMIDWEEQERAEILGETLSDEQMEELEEALYSDMHGKIS